MREIGNRLVIDSFSTYLEKQLKVLRFKNCIIEVSSVLVNALTKSIFFNSSPLSPANQRLCCRMQVEYWSSVEPGSLDGQCELGISDSHNEKKKKSLEVKSGERADQ